MPEAWRYFTTGTLAGTASLFVVCAHVATAQASHAVVGTVVDPSGHAVYGAEVSSEPASQRVRTDELGRFRLTGVAPGAMTIAVRRLGFTPGSTRILKPNAGPTTLSDSALRIVLLPLPATLPAVMVQTTKVSYSGRLAGFYERLERRVTGVFVSRAEIDASNARTLPQLLQRLAGVTVVRGRVGGSTVRFRGNTCAPLLWVDGSPMPASEVDLELFAPQTLHGIELYAGSTTAPARFLLNRDKNSCGTIVLWSRGPDTDPILPRPGPTINLEQMVASLTVYTADAVETRVRLADGFSFSVDYPPDLFAAGIGGAVLAEFVIDTQGKLEEGTFGIVSSTDPKFSDVVRRAVQAGSYVPAVKGGHAVRQLMQLPFTFTPKPAKGSN
jgi:TonB family protein